MDCRELSLLRLGAVSYVNALPLLDGLADAPGVSLHLEPPARVAVGLLEGRYDAGLVPAAALLHNQELVAVGTACIASAGAVDSVLLLLSTAPQRVRRLSLDPESRSSQILARWVLQERHGARPVPTERRVGEEALSCGDDAALVIGDKALLALDQGTPCLDLGAEWFAATGLPFVYAVWAVRRTNPELAQIAARLDAAAARGAANIAGHALEAARRLALNPARCLVYLTRRIRYRFGDDEAAGLAHFLAEARRLGA